MKSLYPFSMFAVTNESKRNSFLFLFSLSLLIYSSPASINTAYTSSIVCQAFTGESSTLPVITREAAKSVRSASDLFIIQIAITKNSAFQIYKKLFKTNEPGDYWCRSIQSTENIDSSNNITWFNG